MVRHFFHPYVQIPDELIYDILSGSKVEQWLSSYIKAEILDHLTFDNISRSGTNQCAHFYGYFRYLDIRIAR
jgi:hypothetical protein